MTTGNKYLGRKISTTTHGSGIKVEGDAGVRFSLYETSTGQKGAKIVSYKYGTQEAHLYNEDKFRISCLKTIAYNANFNNKVLAAVIGNNFNNLKQYTNSTTKSYPIGKLVCVQDTTKDIGSNPKSLLDNAEFALKYNIALLQSYRGWLNAIEIQGAKEMLKTVDEIIENSQRILNLITREKIELLVEFLNQTNTVKA